MTTEDILRTYFAEKNAKAGGYTVKVFEDMTKNPGKFTQNPDGSWSEGGGVHSE